MKNLSTLLNSDSKYSQNNFNGFALEMKEICNCESSINKMVTLFWNKELEGISSKNMLSQMNSLSNKIEEQLDKSIEK